jgi:hypothetical protein
MKNLLIAFTLLLFAGCFSSPEPNVEDAGAVQQVALESYTLGWRDGYNAGRKNTYSFKRDSILFTSGKEVNRKPHVSW